MTRETILKPGPCGSLAADGRPSRFCARRSCLNDANFWPDNPYRGRAIAGDPAVTCRRSCNTFRKHRVELEVIVQGCGRDAELCHALRAIGVRYSADHTPLVASGGLGRRPEADRARLNLPVRGGRANLKAGVLTIVLHYSLGSAS